MSYVILNSIRPSSFKAKYSSLLGRRHTSIFDFRPATSVVAYNGRTATKTQHGQ